MAGMTPRQKKWFATVQANFEAQTGKPIAEWLEILKACPATTSGKQSAWLRTEYGVGVNHAAYILSCADTAGEPGWDDPDGLRAQLWKDANSEAILAALEALAVQTEGVVIGQRKSFTSFSRSVQFAAVRPLKGGRALIGFKLAPELSVRLAAPTRREAWSERLTAVVEIDQASQIDPDLEGLFVAAAARG
ncbi:MAG: DUF4287 domain-containing protein [Caulobacterales bacterium]|nr:DUF4287 domain-containing protein [Caulobacterales bacterium]